MTAILEDRLREIEVVSLRPGKHNPANVNGIEMCAMEAVAYVAGEPWSDEPQCACPVIAAAVRYFNDDLRSDEERNEWLKPLIPRLVGTRDESKVVARAAICADFALRVFTPISFENAGLVKEAQSLRSLDPVTADEAFEAVNTAAQASRTAWAATSPLAARVAEWAARAALAASGALAASAAKGAARAAGAVRVAEWTAQAAQAALAAARGAEVVLADGDDARRVINSARRDLIEAMLNA